MSIIHDRKYHLLKFYEFAKKISQIQKKIPQMHDHALFSSHYTEIKITQFFFHNFQVKRLKDEIRRLSTAQRQNVQNLDSTYVARPPLVEKSTCSNCQNKPQKAPNTVQKPPVYDDEAFMKYDGTGVFATGLTDSLLVY